MHMFANQMASSVLKGLLFDAVIMSDNTVHPCVFDDGRRQAKPSMQQAGHIRGTMHGLHCMGSVVIAAWELFCNSTAGMFVSVSP